MKNSSNHVTTKQYPNEIFSSDRLSFFGEFTKFLQQFYKKVVTCFEGGGSTCCQRFSCQSFKKSPLQILSKLKLEDLQQWLDVGFICILCYDQINDHDLALKEPFFLPFHCDLVTWNSFAKKSSIIFRTMYTCASLTEKIAESRT